MPKALIVDDSLMMRRIVADVLRKVGDFQTVESHDGTDALEKLKNHPDTAIILLDYNMPFMDGLEFTKRVRADGIHTPILMVTNEVNVNLVRQCIRAGANGYLTKPFRIDHLMEKVKTLLGTGTDGASPAPEGDCA